MTAIAVEPAVRNRLLPLGGGCTDLDVRELGGKGLNLFRLAGMGFTVPPFWIVPAGVLNDALGWRTARVADVLAGLDCTSPETIARASNQIRAVLLDAGVESGLRGEIGEELANVLDGDMLYAVRSSVVGEDSAAHSFAGQMDSLLNVPAARVITAILEVWASAFSARALAYRHRKQLSVTQVSTAVIVQEMVQSAVSGVLFTRNPETGKRQCVICAGYGLGEGVVADRVDTDTYRLAWDASAIASEVSEKTSRMVLDPAGRGGTRQEAVPPELRSRPALTAAQLVRLRESGVRAELGFDSPQDIEWAFDQRGRLFLLQARPICSTARRIQSGSYRVWDNSNIVESYPGITLPLTFSFARFCYEAAFRRFARLRALGFPPFRNPIRKRLHIFRNMIGLLEGRVYYNLLTWYEMMSFLPGFSRYKEAWDRMIGVAERVDLPEGRLPLINRLCAWAFCLWKLLTVRRTARNFAARFERVYAQFNRIDLTHATVDELIAVYESLVHELADKWSLTLDNDFAAMIYYDALRSLGALWGLSAHPNLHNDLLCGESGMESVAPVHSLARIAAMFEAQPRYPAALSAQDDRDIWNTIQHDPDYAPLRRALEAHLDAYGDRGVEELKLEQPSFREQPETLIAAIRAHFSVGRRIDATVDREQRIREAAETHARNHLTNPLRRTLFGFVLQQTRLAVANRENMRFARSRLFGLARRIFRRMGEIFADQGVIESSADIHYLTVEEIFGFVQGASVTRNLAALIELRKADYAQFSRRNPGERIPTTGIPYLNQLDTALAATASGHTALGTGCSSGVAAGTARVIRDPRQSLAPGDHILVARSTDPGWIFLMLSAKGIVVEKGSVLSHTAIIGRELGIPTIVGVKGATQRIPDLAPLLINGATGEISWRECLQGG